MIKCILCGNLNNSMMDWEKHACAIDMQRNQGDFLAFENLLSDQLASNFQTFLLEGLRLEKTELHKYGVICRFAHHQNQFQTDEWYIKSLLSNRDQAVTKDWVNFLQYFSTAQAAIKKYQEISNGKILESKNLKYPFLGIFFAEPLSWYE